MAPLRVPLGKGVPGALVPAKRAFQGHGPPGRAQHPDVSGCRGEECRQNEAKCAVLGCSAARGQLGCVPRSWRDRSLHKSAFN